MKSPLYEENGKSSLNLQVWTEFDIAHTNEGLIGNLENKPCRQQYHVGVNCVLVWGEIEDETENLINLK